MARKSIKNKYEKALEKEDRKYEKVQRALEKKDLKKLSRWIGNFAKGKKDWVD